MASGLDLRPLPKQELRLVPSVLVNNRLAEILVAELFVFIGKSLGLVYLARHALVIYHCADIQLIGEYKDRVIRYTMAAKIKFHYL